jgi:hypothetical protein
MQFQLPIADAVLQFAVLGTAVLVVQLTLERLHLPAITGLLVRLRGVLPPPSTLTPYSQRRLRRDAGPTILPCSDLIPGGVTWPKYL